MKIMCTTQIILVLSVLMMVGPVAARAEDGSAKPASASGSRAEPAPDLRKMTPDEFKAALAKSADPVALASKYANLREYDVQMMAAPTAKLAMDVLAEHWQDPRARAILEQIAKGEPKHYGELGPTAAGEAADRLDQMEARKQRHDLLENAKNPQQIMEKIRAFFKEHPKWLHNAETADKEYLVRFLLEDAEKAGGDDAVDLVVESERYDIVPKFVKRHPDAALAYAKKIGRERALDLGYLFQGLGGAGVQAAGPLLEGWLTEETDVKRIGAAVGVLAVLRDGRDRLIRLLSSSQPEVSLTAASYLERIFPSKDTLAAIEGELRKRKEQGSEESYVLKLEMIEKRLREDIIHKKGA